MPTRKVEDRQARLEEEEETDLLVDWSFFGEWFFRYLEIIVLLPD